jgi:putative endonuclease
MVFVYVIESLTDKTWYTGIALNAENRLNEHNSGKNRFTKGHRPWKIIYTEVHDNWQKARDREKYLKSAAGKRWLEKELNRRAGSLPDRRRSGGESSLGH